MPRKGAGFQTNRWKNRRITALVTSREGNARLKNRKICCVVCLLTMSLDSVETTRASVRVYVFWAGIYHVAVILSVARPDTEERVKIVLFHFSTFVNTRQTYHFLTLIWQRNDNDVSHWCSQAFSIMVRDLSARGPARLLISLLLFHQCFHICSHQCETLVKVYQAHCAPQK